MLEDELAQLERDGMFISVAAGNDFLDFGEPGLSYPAASPHVVPVASVGSDGKLSDFSQRNSRVLAGPGERITSTVPDYLYSFDGVPNDFAAASGTSMAAPYIAGASVLLREALQFVGYADISQDTIYSHLRDAADVVHDPLTGRSYHRINLRAALDAIMPADDYASTAASGHQLGTIATGTSRTGLIGRLDDVDFFRFTAGVTGVATVSATISDSLQPQWQLTGAAGQFDGESVTFDVVEGQTYTIGIGTSGGIGHYSLDVGIEQTLADWGTIGHARRAGEIVRGEAWYRLATVDNGVLVVDAAFSPGGGDIDIELYNGAGDLVATGADTASGERIQFSASAGQTYFVRATGTNANVEYRATNVATVGGTTRTVLIEDFTSDGFTDVLVRRADGSWRLTTTTTSGATSQFWGRWNETAGWSDVTTGDFDNDGRLDVIGRTHDGDWWVGRNTGAGIQNQFWGRWSGRVRWSDVSLGDFDNDGNLDVAGRTTWGEWWVAVNEGHRFSNRFWGRWSSRETWSDVTALDVDGDGDTDILSRSGSGQWWLARSTVAGFVSEPWIGPAASGVLGATGSEIDVSEPSTVFDAEATGPTRCEPPHAPPARDGGSPKDPWDHRSTQNRGSFVPTGDFDANSHVGAVRGPHVGSSPVAQDGGTGWLRKYRGVCSDAWHVAGRDFDRSPGEKQLSDAAVASIERWEPELDLTAGLANRGLEQALGATCWPGLADRLFSQYGI
jgi:hypothetical protein